MPRTPKPILTPEEAAALIPDGATITISSSAAQLVPDTILAGIESRFLARRQPADLTVVFPLAVGDSFGTVGLDHLAHPGLIRRLIGGSYVNGPASKPSPKIYAMIHADQVEAYKRALEGDPVSAYGGIVGFNRALVEWALDHLERGARRAGRRVEELEIIWAVRMGTAATTSEARRAARPTAVHWGIRWDGQWLERAGIRTPKLQVPDAVWKVYPDLSHAHDWEEAIAATSFVPDEVVAELCDALGLVGTPEYCAERIGEMAKLGARNLYLMPFETFALPESEIRAFRDVIFPQLRAAGLR
ncbi:MAG: LLM class flavin-dependent oxidoreductase [Betaproteobacteria bacterium]|nr:LLM class flavin-dependent oxidoreductase [Betaproteobacteria bacterium]